MQQSELKRRSPSRSRALVLGTTIAVVLIAGALAANARVRFLLPHAAPAAVATTANAGSSLNALEQHPFPATDPNRLELASYRGAKLVLFFYEMAG